MKIFIQIFLLFITSLTWSQNYKFGKVSKAELEEKFYPLDSTANAAVLYSERNTYFEFGRGMIDHYFTRIKIYSKEGYDEATKRILLFRSYNGDEEELLTLKAYTYNLVDGKIEKTKLSKDNIFEERLAKFVDYKVFTMPNLKPGSIIEWTYTKKAFVNRLQEVILQDDIPIKKLKKQIAFPDFYKYNTRIKGYLPINIKKSAKSKTTIFGYRADFNYEEIIHLVEKNNIPAIKNEPYSGNIDNYKSGILYELSLIKYPDGYVKKYARDWEQIVLKLYDSWYFGEQLKKDKHFEDDLNKLLDGTDVRKEKVYKILQFVKEKIKWNKYLGYYTDNGVKKAYNKGEGNVADINLNLVLMLKSVGLDATPVLVSTVNNGIPLFPTKYGFNYVIAMVITPTGNIFLDATEKNTTLNVLPNRALNFQGLAIYKNGSSEWIDLFPKDHAIDKTIINTKYNEEGFKGTARKTISNDYLLAYRDAVRDINREALLDWIDKETKGVDVINARVTNLDNLNKNIVETIQFETEDFYVNIENKTYIAPLLYNQITENPFKSEKREFPVFFKKPWAKSVIVNLKIPESYTIEDVPESVDYLFPNDMGTFTYSIVPQGQNIKINSTFLINSPIISIDHYKNLKDFYKKVIAKQNEKIVLSKK